MGAGMAVYVMLSSLDSPNVVGVNALSDVSPRSGRDGAPLRKAIAASAAAAAVAVAITADDAVDDAATASLVDPNVSR